MPRWAAVLLIGMTLATGLVVALVRAQAQESSRRGNWQSPTEGEGPTASGGSSRTGPTVVRPSGNLMDRLRAIRKESNDAGASTGSPSQTPAEPTPTEPTRNPAESGYRFEPTPTSVRPNTQFNANPRSEPTAGSESTANRWQWPGRTTAPSTSSASPASPSTAPSAGAFQQGGTYGGASQGIQASNAPREGDDGDGDDGELQSVLKQRPTPAGQGFAPVNRMNQYSRNAEPTPESAPAETPRLASEPQDAPWNSSRRGATTSDLSPKPAASRDWRSGGATTRAGSSAESVVISSVGPALRVETTGPASVAIGQEAEYTVSVVNLSDAAADNVQVSINIPAWVQLTGGDTSTGRTTEDGIGTSGKLTWQAGRIAPHATEELQLKVVPRANQPFELSVVWGFSPPAAVAQVEVQEPQLQVALLGPDDVQFGQSTVYTIVLNNPGTGDAQQVSVELAPLVPGGEGGGSQQIGTLAAGEKKEIQIEVTPRQAGALNLQVAAAASGNLRSEAAKQVRVRRAELQLAATGPELKYAGSVANYQVNVVNTGDAEAAGVQVDVALPAGARYVGGVDQAQVSGQGVHWSVGRLPAGAQRIFNVQCELISSGDVSVEVNSRAEGGLSSSAAVATRVESIADVTLTVRDPQGPRPVGGDAVYEIVVTNRGTKEARGVKAVVQFSEGVEPISSDGQQADIVPGQVVFSPIDRLEPGQEKVLKVVARADKAGNHVFRAEVRCPEPETRRVSEGTTRFFESSNASRGGSIGAGQLR